MPTPVWWAIWFIAGACLGSFANVCIYRLPREESIVWPRSHCPRCAKTIAWHDNIPLLSFAALGARCRHCGGAIRWRYPLVEALCGALMVAALHRFGMTPAGVVYAVFVLALVVATFVDIDFQIIPDEISLGGLALGLALSPLIPSLHGTEDRLAALGRSVIGALVGGGWLYTTGSACNLAVRGLRLLGVRLRRRPAWRKRLARYRHVRDTIGGGDIKLMAMAGSLLGWKLVTLAFFLAPPLGAIPGVVLAMFRGVLYIPYGPYLSAALMLALFFGDALLRAVGLEDTVRFFLDYYRGGG